MIFLMVRIIVALLIIFWVYKFGVKCGRSENLPHKKSQLYLHPQCDGCKKIKPTSGGMSKDRFGNVTGVNITCGKAGSCKGRKDKE